MKKVLHVLDIVFFLLILLVGILFISKLLERKESTIKLKPYLDHAAEYDVLFTGNSHMINDVFPMELWEKYGIAAYNIAGNGNTIPVSYWTLRISFDYALPKLIVLDINDIVLNDKVSGHSSNVHTAMDAYPLTPTKIQAIQDLMNLPGVEDFDGNELRDIRWEYLFTLGKYHSRWSELSPLDFDYTLNQEKGGHHSINVADARDYDVIDYAQDESGYGFEYLRMMIELCREQGVEMLLVNLPYPASESQQMGANLVGYIAEEYEINYINFVDLDQVVDYEVDMFDVDSHLNPSGAKKVTDYLGKYIRDHYDLPDRRNDPAYAHWYEDKQTYLDIKKNYLLQESLENVLMLLHDTDIDCCIRIAKDSAVYDSDKLYTLMQNIPREHIYEEDAFAKWSSELFPLGVFDDACITGESYLLCLHHGEDTEMMEFLGELEEGTYWAGENWALQVPKDGALAIEHNGQLHYLSSEPVDVVIELMDAKTGEWLGERTFTLE